jgi:hypothetical protein
VWASDGEGKGILLGRLRRGGQGRLQHLKEKKEKKGVLDEYLISIFLNTF